MVGVSCRGKASTVSGLQNHIQKPRVFLLICLKDTVLLCQSIVISMIQTLAKGRTLKSGDGFNALIFFFLKSSKKCTSFL